MKPTNITTSIKEYQLPSTCDLERQLLADLASSPEAIGEAMRFVTDEAFTSDDRKGIWRTYVDCFNKGAVIDMTTMYDRCGNAFLNECITSGVQGGTERSAIQHAALLRDAAARRRGYFAAVAMLKATTESDKTIDDMCAIAEALGRDVQGDTAVVNEIPLDNVLNDITAELAERRRLSQEGKLYRVPTGFKLLDWNTYQGWGQGQLVVLAARPSVGKTALMLKFAKTAAKAGFPVDIFSLEMTAKELGQRLLYSTGEVLPVDINTGFVNEDKYNGAVGTLKSLPIHINDTSRSLEEIVARMSINVRAGRCKIAFIDYLGLMNIQQGYRESLNQVIGKITSELKATAKRLQIPIVLLCQLNREMAKGDRAPELYDLRDSGNIEQDADIVMMLENDPTIEPTTGLKDINIWLRKNRQYKRDICITVRPNKTYSDFEEISGGITQEEAAATAPAEELNDDDDKKLF